MPAANGLFANGGWLQSPRDIEFASKGAFRFRELKTELRDIFSCFLRPDYLGEFADDVIESRTLVDTGVTPGTYNNVTVNSKGQVESATLKDPLGDPIHSPGGSGFIDCGDIPVPNVTVKGFTRVHIDPFGRTIEGDCVAPHALSPQTYDTLTVDQHGRTTSGNFNNHTSRISALETAVATLADRIDNEIGYIHAFNDMGGVQRTSVALGTSTKTLVTGKTYVAIVGIEYARNGDDGDFGSYELLVNGNGLSLGGSINVTKTGDDGHFWSWTTGGCYIIPFTVGSTNQASFQVQRTGGTENILGASILVVG